MNLDVDGYGYDSPDLVPEPEPKLLEPAYVRVASRGEPGALPEVIVLVLLDRGERTRGRIELAPETAVELARLLAGATIRPVA